MELDEKERAFLEPYLRLAAGKNRRWMVGVAVGLVLCVASAVLYSCGLRPALMFALFVLGLVVVDFFVEERRKTMLARILQKYENALAEAKKERERAQSQEG